MAGDGRKVKLGAAWVNFGTVLGNLTQKLDLGYTKGGVSFTMETATHEMTVDQEGTTPIAEIIMGRKVSINCPMAESNYSRLHYLTPESDYNADATGYLMRIASGVGSCLMNYADEVLITSKADPNDWIKIFFGAPVANLNASFTADGERIWPVTFKGYVVPIGMANAGYILGIHEGT